MPWPPDLPRGERTEPVDIGQLAPDIHDCLREYFRTHGHSPRCASLLPKAQRDLRKLLPTLSAGGHAYIGELVRIVEAVLERGAPTRES